MKKNNELTRKKLRVFQVRLHPSRPATDLGMNSIQVHINSSAVNISPTNIWITSVEPVQVYLATSLAGNDAPNITWLHKK